MQISLLEEHPFIIPRSRSIVTFSEWEKSVHVSNDMVAMFAKRFSWSLGRKYSAADKSVVASFWSFTVVGSCVVVVSAFRLLCRRRFEGLVVHVEIGIPTPNAEVRAIAENRMVFCWCCSVKVFCEVISIALVFFGSLHRCNWQFVIYDGIFFRFFRRTNRSTFHVFDSDPELFLNTTRREFASVTIITVNWDNLK